MSALTGEGVDAWLEYVAEQSPAGQHLVDVDYETYAAGEAALGWLNASVVLRANSAVYWAQFAFALLGDIHRTLTVHSAEIAHLKLFLRQGEHSVTGNVTDNASNTIFLSNAMPWTAGDATMQLNARVHVAPEELQKICEHALRTTAAAFGLTWRITALQSFSPSRPVPTHRFIRTHHAPP